MNNQIASLVKSVNSATITSGHRLDINSLIRRAKGHAKVVALYEAGDAAGALLAAHKVGAVPADYEGKGLPDHSDEVNRLVELAKSRLENALKAYARNFG